MKNPFNSNGKCRMARRRIWETGCQGMATHQQSVRVLVKPLIAMAPGTRETVLVDLDHSPSRSYLLGSDYRAQITLVSSNTR